MAGAVRDLLSPEAVLAAVKISGKKALLQEMAARAAIITGLPERRIFETLIERERLGSTGMGQGIVDALLVGDGGLARHRMRRHLSVLTEWWQ